MSPCRGVRGRQVLPLKSCTAAGSRWVVAAPRFPNHRQGVTVHFFFFCKMGPGENVAARE